MRRLNRLSNHQKPISPIKLILFAVIITSLTLKVCAFQGKGSAPTIKPRYRGASARTSRKTRLVSGETGAEDLLLDKLRLSAGRKKKSTEKSVVKKKSTKKKKSNTKNMDGRQRKKQKRNEVIDLTEDDEDGRKPAAVINSNVPKNGSNHKFSLCSYNVWFGPPHPFERMSAICEAIAAESPLFVGLQEVTPELSQMLFPLLESVGYQTVVQDMSGIGYGCAVAIKENACDVVASGFHPYRDTIMGRGIVWVLAKVRGINREVLFTTTHLESFVRNHPSPGQTYDGGRERELQVKQLDKFCQDCMTKRASVVMAVITGDLNWDDQRKRSSGIDKPLLDVLDDSWCDAWLETNPGKEGYTYDSKESAMLRGNLRRRLDRCLLKRRNSNQISLEETALIGKDPIPGLEWRKQPHPMARSQAPVVVPVLPSDHFGLLVKLRTTPS